jgi:hypothetical protein
LRSAQPGGCYPGRGLLAQVTSTNFKDGQTRSLSYFGSYFGEVAGEAACDVAGELACAAAGEAAGALEGAGDATGTGVASGAVDCKTERVPVTPGSDSVRAINMKAAAAPMVIFDKILAVPRGPKAVLDTLLEKRSPAPDFPG